jgi:hypothetical protein
MKQNIGRIAVSFVFGALFALLCTVAVMQHLRHSRTLVSQLISNDVTHLASMLTQIDEQCGIKHVSYDTTLIDFLTVRSFVGNAIGTIELAHPEKWQGPYRYENPTIQGKHYRIVKLKDCLCVAPGEGVILSDGSIVGKQAKIESSMSYKTVIADKHLWYSDKPLVVPLLIAAQAKQASTQAAS